MCGLKLLKQFIHSGNQEVVRLLLENGANINAKNNIGMTALIVAAARGRFKIGENKID